MYHQTHGGGCCGMGHIYSMGLFEPTDEMKADKLSMLNCYIEELQEDLIDDEIIGDSFLLEVVINAAQRKGWGVLLTERGFKEVNSFNNNNTGNTCYIYHLIE